MVGILTESGHLRVFSPVMYRHVLGQLRKKLDDKGEMMISVGYHSTSGYKFFDVANMGFVIR